MSDPALPDLADLGVFDERLRQVAADPARVEQALARASTALAATNDAADRVRLLAYIGNAERMLGRSEDAIAHLRESATTARKHGHQRAHAIALIRIGEAYRRSDRLVESEEQLRAALTIVADVPLDGLRDFALQHLGKCLVETGRSDEAVSVLEEALAIREEKGAADLIASTELALAWRADGRSYLSKSRSIRRDETQSPTSPSASRYATLTSWNGPTVPVVSERMSSIPW